MDRLDSAAAIGSDSKERHPMPVRRWRRVPDRYSAASSASCGVRAERITAAIAVRLAIRERVAATWPEASTIVLSSMCSSNPTANHRFFTIGPKR